MGTVMYLDKRVLNSVCCISIRYYNMKEKCELIEKNSVFFVYIICKLWYNIYATY